MTDIFLLWIADADCAVRSLSLQPVHVRWRYPCWCSCMRPKMMRGAFAFSSPGHLLKDLPHQLHIISVIAHVKEAGFRRAAIRGAVILLVCSCFGHAGVHLVQDLHVRFCTCHERSEDVASQAPNNGAGA